MTNKDIKTENDGYKNLPTIGDIKKMPNADGWGEIPTIGDLMDTSDDW